MNDPDKAEGVHGWVAYLRTLDIETAEKGNCDGDPALMPKLRFPALHSNVPEVRQALELYVNDDVPLVRLLARAYLAESLEEAEDLVLLTNRDAEACVMALHFPVHYGLVDLIQKNGVQADSTQHPALFQLGAKKHLKPLKVWGHLGLLESEGCVIEPALYFEIEGGWVPLWSKELEAYSESME